MSSHLGFLNRDGHAKNFQIDERNSSQTVMDNFQLGELE